MKEFINWFEIPAKDISRASKFYSSLFEMKLKICDCGEEKMAFFPENDLNVWGAISQVNGFDASQNGVVIYFNAEGRLDELIERSVELGGSILINKTKIEAEERGYFAHITDSEGNRIGLYTS